MAASATTATEMNEPNILRKVVKAVSDERVGWKEIEAWGIHLHTWRTSLYVKSLDMKVKQFGPLLDRSSATLTMFDITP